MEPLRTQPVPRVRSALSALVDVIFVLVVIAASAAGVFAVFDPRANDAMARGYARHLGLTDQAQCPSNFGNSFWFACAGEVRRLHPPPTEVVRNGEPRPGEGLYLLHHTR